MNKHQNSNTMQEVEITINGNFVKQDETDLFVSVDANGYATFTGLNGNYQVQATNFSVQEHPIHAPK